VFPICLWNLFTEGIQKNDTSTTTAQSVKPRVVNTLRQRASLCVTGTSGTHNGVSVSPAAKEHLPVIFSVSGNFQTETSRVVSVTSEKGTDTFAYVGTLKVSGLPDSATQTWDCLDSLEEWLNSEETLEETQFAPLLPRPNTATEAKATRQELSNLSSAGSTTRQSGPLRRQSSELQMAESCISKSEISQEGAISEVIIIEDDDDQEAVILDTSNEDSSHMSSCEWSVSSAVKVELENIAQNPRWGQKVRKSWRHLILSGSSKVFRYLRYRYST
jgi:hypothetical protein